jgi:hypothetical protein
VLRFLRAASGRPFSFWLYNRVTIMKKVVHAACTVAGQAGLKPD